MLLNIGNVASYVFDDGDSKGPSMFLPNKGSFKNYVDKNRGVWGQWKVHGGTFVNVHFGPLEEAGGS